ATPRATPGWAALAGAAVLSVNRQRGSGTRVLLDYRLAQLGISPRSVRGYEREEYTHLAVAAQVASGAADTGLAILASARALELDFVPLFSEQYQLVIPRQHYESEQLAPLLEILRGEEFHALVRDRGGDQVADRGAVVWQSF